MQLQETLDPRQIKKIIKFDDPVTGNIFDLREIRHPLASAPALDFGLVGIDIVRLLRNMSVKVTLHSLYREDGDNSVFAEIKGRDRNGEKRNILLTLKDVKDMVWRARCGSSDTTVTVDCIYTEQTKTKYDPVARDGLDMTTTFPFRGFRVIHSDGNKVIRLVS